MNPEEIIIVPIVSWLRQVEVFPADMDHSFTVETIQHVHLKLTVSYIFSNQLLLQSMKSLSFSISISHKI